MTLPNFLIIGAAKAATTSIWFYINQHPEIFMSKPKELKFFAFEGKKLDFKGPGDHIYNISAVTDFETYRSYFEKVKNERAVGESCPIYLSVKGSAERIVHYIPECKIIAILRNPADRAFSHYLHRRREGQEKITDFEKALSVEKSRIKKNYAPGWHYVTRGFYYDNLKHFFDIFGEQNIRIYLYDNFSKNPQKILQDIFRFLEVDDGFIPDTSKKINDSFIPRNRLKHIILKRRWYIYMLTNNIISAKYRRKMIRKLNKMWDNNKYKPQLSKQKRKKLIDIFHDDIIKTQQLINQDLSSWLNCEIQTQNRLK